MGDFRQDGGKRFGGGNRGGFGGRDGGRSNFSGGRDRGPVTMHQAVCDQCGKPCEVPFRPTDGKPVYCNVCFGAKKNAGVDRGGDRYSQENNSYKAPVHTDSGSNVGKGNIDDVKKQLVILNVKMDRLIKAAEAISGTKPVTVEEKVKQAVNAVPVAKEKKALKKIAKKKKK